MRRVYVLDNGGISFVVELNPCGPSATKCGPGTARVLAHKPDFTDEIDHRDTTKHSLWLKPWRTFKYTRALIGLEPPQKPGLFERLFQRDPERREANSVLLELSPQKYLVIGESVFTFQAEDDDYIMQFVSPVYNSGVTYHYAIGRKNTYLTLMHTYIPNDELQRLREATSMHDVNPNLILFNTGQPFRRGDRGAAVRKARAAQKAYTYAHPLKGFKLLHDRLF